MNEHLEYTEEIAREAVTLYGQNWEKLSVAGQDRWRGLVRSISAGGGESEPEKIAGRAVQNWYDRQTVSTVNEIVGAAAVEDTKPLSKKKK